jgi:hypothetical protein
VARCAAGGKGIGIEQFEPEQLAADVEAIGQGGRTGQREGIALRTIGLHHFGRDRLFIVQRRKGQRALCHGHHARAMAHRHDRVDRRIERPGGKIAQRLEQPVTDALRIEPAQTADFERGVGAHLRSTSVPSGCHRLTLLSVLPRSMTMMLPRANCFALQIPRESRAVVLCGNDQYQSILIISTKNVSAVLTRCNHHARIAPSSPADRAATRRPNPRRMP